LSSDDAGAVEVYAPIKWLADYPGGPHLFIHNTRDKDSWLRSCTKVYRRSQESNWNHPIWKYPLEHFSDYYDDWHARIRRGCVGTRNVELIAKPSWRQLCRILDVDEPDAPFPNQDMTRDRRPALPNFGFGFKDPLQLL
jgi:hypothetical protein